MLFCVIHEIRRNINFETGEMLASRSSIRKGEFALKVSFFREFENDKTKKNL